MMRSGDTTEAAFLPAIHALHLGEVTARYGVPSRKLLAECSLLGRDLTQPDERISIATAEHIADSAVAMTGEPALPWLLGVQMRISAYGYLGFAAMVASTIGDALTLVSHFTPTRTNAVGLRLVVDGTTAMVVIDELAPLDGAREMIVIALMESIRQLGRALTGKSLVGTLELAAPEPPYFARLLRDGAVSPARFDCTENRIVFDAAILDLPLVNADPSALRMATASCERELARVRDVRRTSTRVRQVVARNDGLSSTLEDVARVLDSSTRTLKRRLAGEGTTFTAIIDELRRDEGMRLVESSDLKLELISQKLGYSDLGNFTRAYRRWTGKPPSLDRRQRKGAVREGTTSASRT